MAASAEPVATHRRRWPWVLAVVVVLVILAALATWFLRRDDAPKTPRATAQAWANDVVHHRTDDAAALQCRRDLHTDLDVIGMTASEIDGVQARSSTPEGDGRWRVSLETLPASSGSTLTVSVVRRGGSYVVCD